jgi:hypothetical protein
MFTLCLRDINQQIILELAGVWHSWSTHVEADRCDKTVYVISFHNFHAVSIDRRIQLSHNEKDRQVTQYGGARNI